MVALAPVIDSAACILVFSACLIPLTPQAPVRPCEPSLWDESRPLFADSSALAFPTIAFRGDRVVVVGSPLVAETPMGMAIAVVDGESIAAPVRPVALQPLPAVSGDGRFHLFWGEPSAPADSSDPASLPFRIGRIFHARHLGAGSQIIVNRRRLDWTTPETIYQGDLIQWTGDAGAASPPLVSPDGSIHLVFHIQDRQRLVYLRATDGLTRITEFPQPDAGVDASLARDKDGAIYLSYLGPRPLGSAPDGNSVLLRRSNDGGEHWDEAVLVSRSGRLPAHNLRMAITRGGVIHLVWRQLVDDGRSAAVWYASSRDGGRSWTQPGAWRFADAYPNAIRVAADSAGGAHAIVSAAPGLGLPGHLYYATWSDDGWTTPCRIPDALDAAHPDLATDPAGRLYLVWNRVFRKASGIDGSALYTKLSTSR